MKKIKHHFLHFTRKEKNGTIFLLVIILCLVVLPALYPLFMQDRPIAHSNFAEELAKLKTVEKDTIRKRLGSFDAGDLTGEGFRRPASQESATSVTLFYFDPNKLSGAKWKELGLNEKTIATIQRYVSKGGRFREPADIKKIWGIPAEKAEVLLPYVRIEQELTATHNRFPAYEKKEFQAKPVPAVDINFADSAAFDALPGIGPGYAKRILKFRERLGGFYHTGQVAETFGLPDSAFQKIKGYLKISGDHLRKININTATLDSLKQHPYIRYHLANAIIQFRVQHGNFSSVADIKKIMLVTEDLFQKIAPYLTIR